jgi:tetratricopeptide (TPR) repeat protein
MQALAASRFAEAEALFRAVIAADPRIEQAYLALAESLLAQNRGREATIAVTQLAQRMVQSGREGEARDLLGRVLQIDPGFAVAHAILGMALLSLGEFSDAATELNRAMELGETSTQTRLMLAAAQWEAGQFDAAEVTYRESIDISGGDPVALQQLGSLLLWQGRFEEAVEPLDRSARGGAPSVDLLYDLGRALDGAGQLEAARQVLSQAVAAAPTHAQARYAYARLLVRTGNTEQAREQMAEWQRLYQAEQVMLHESKLAAARLERGWTLLNQGQAQAAADQFRDLPTSVDSLYGLGLSLSALGDHSGAAQAIESALRLDPDRRDIQRRLAVERLSVEGQQ